MVFVCLELIKCSKSSELGFWTKGLGDKILGIGQMVCLTLFELKNGHV